ncbi:Do family serine endopeptidase [Pleionea sediminis]|uniref:Do family serine endopeptidase n=1 Tax=Pleionea sediminis TaxID=2569479 RepID=UPI001FEC166F|nr:Do family serine endopeptidase [Pleionea sediminis]
MKFVKANVLLLLVALAGVVQASRPDFTRVVEDVRDSVVVITTEVESRGRQAQGPSGSGFIIDNDGYVLTNRHVIHGVKSIYVQLVNKKVYKAELLGEDEDSDIALLKIDAKDLKAVKIGDVEKLKVGAWVLAYGAPFGLEHTVTAGIVSAKGRSLAREQYVPFIQTDAAINRGNSGGPLFNEKGEVVGINSQIFSMTGGNMGLAFAIPMDLAMDVAEQLREDGRVSRGFLGVMYQDVDYDTMQAFELDEVKGALLRQVTKDSPAEEGGLKVGDIVIEVDGKEVGSAADLPFLVGRIKPGKEVEMVILRNGDRKTLDITIGERPQSEVADRGRPGGESNAGLGMTVVELDDRIREMADVEYGVLVREVISGPARDAGIREGDILQMLNQQRINSIEDYQSALDRLPEIGSVAVLVNRRGMGPRFLVLKLGNE